MTEFVKKEDLLWYAPPIDPGDELDYTLNFEDVFPTGDNITTVTWTATSGITIISASNTFTNTTATVWLKSATLGQTFEITAKVTTAAGRIAERSFMIQCMNL